jgi:ribosome-associated protein
MPSSAPRDVPVRATPIALAAFLKFAGVCESGGAAKEAIAGGSVEVNGQVETRRGRKLQAGDKVSCDGSTLIVAVG